MSALEDRLHEALTGDDPGRVVSPDLFDRVVGSIDDDRRRRRRHPPHRHRLGGRRSPWPPPPSSPCREKD